MYFAYASNLTCLVSSTNMISAIVLITFNADMFQEGSKLYLTSQSQLQRQHSK